MLETLETRRLMDAAVRTYDGTGNNLAHPEWGSTAESLLRLARVSYGDGISTPAGSTRASARAVSNAVAVHGTDETLNERHIAAYGYAWGQFIDHDLGLTTGATPAESFNIAVPAGDPYFDPTGTGTQVIPLSRSTYTGGTSTASPRQQVNTITAYIDGSQVYGSDATRAAALRSGVGGRMLTSAGNLLPFNTMGLPNDTAGGPASGYFIAGDVRANENIELTAVHTLFLREHNRLADQIAAQNPTWNDERIYQRARKLVSAEIQAITFNEFLPALLGNNAVSTYRGYRSNVNPGIANEFSTAAFRLGHSMLADDVEFMDNNAEDTHEEVALAEAFFNVPLFLETGADPILKYLASSNSEELDGQVVDGVRNFLFGPPGAGGFDLASLNVQRGRDHGLADYNTTRAAVGLPKVTSFAQISSDVSVQQALQQTYGTVNNIDLWVGGLAENHLSGSSLGPTFSRIVADQFTRVRDGDRFWYERDLSRSDLNFVNNSTLSEIIQRNTTITNIQDQAFIFNTTIEGKLWNDRDGDGRLDRGESVIGGRRVNLLDDTGAIIDSTATNRDGKYSFSGVQVGRVTVVPELPSGWASTTDSQEEVRVTKSENFDRVDFGQRRIGGPGGPNNPHLANNSSAPTQSPFGGGIIEQLDLL